MTSRLIALFAIAFVFSPLSSHGEDDALPEQARAALRKAVDFFRSEVSTSGGYLWRYSDDLARREGEGKATDTQAWVQPPGTPSVGRVYLLAYESTGDAYYLEAARETAAALVRGQLRSGGWDYRIEFDPTLRKNYAYQAEGEAQGQRNVTTLDDNTTQSALRFLMRVDAALTFRDEAVHEAAIFALESLLKAQYPNGAWPQRYSTFPDPDDYPVRRASYPKTWSPVFPGRNYRGFYTFNDNTIADVIDTLFEASRTYDDSNYQAAAERAGDFILLAQMPEPQPAWAQQYDADMHPAWARKFEPPAVTGGESQGVLRTLLDLYRVTGRRKYLEPISRALAWFRRSALADGRLARFYELHTNTPLYFTKDYQLTYSDADMPTHYGFQVGSRAERIAQEYKRLVTTPWTPPTPSPERDRPRLTEQLRSNAQSVINALDPRGAWVTDGRLRYHGDDDPTQHVIVTRTFIENVRTLARYLEASRRVGE